MSSRSVAAYNSRVVVGSLMTLDSKPGDFTGEKGKNHVEMARRIKRVPTLEHLGMTFEGEKESSVQKDCKRSSKPEGEPKAKITLEQIHFSVIFM